MRKTDYEKFKKYLVRGDLQAVSEGLREYLKKGDQDALYLKSQFSLDEDESGETFDKRRAREIGELARSMYPNAIRDLAWMHRHGDEVEPDYLKFVLFLASATMLGHEQSKQELAKVISSELDWPEFEQMSSQKF